MSASASSSDSTFMIPTTGPNVCGWSADLTNHTRDGLTSSIMTSLSCDTSTNTFGPTNAFPTFSASNPSCPTNSLAPAATASRTCFRIRSALATLTTGPRFVSLLRGSPSLYARATDANSAIKGS